MLLLPPRESTDSVRVEAAAGRAGLATVRLPTWRVPRQLVDEGSVDGLYAEPMSADVVAGALQLALLEAPLNWLLSCPAALRGRPVEAMTLEEARRSLSGPAFVKAEDDKSVPPRVYRSAAELPDAAIVAGDTAVLVQGIVRFRLEYRFWCLDGEIVTGSRYAVDQALRAESLHGPESADALSFAAEALREVRETLPTAAVLDVGRTDHGAWAVVEVNAAWGSGLYAANEDAALPAIRASVVPTARLGQRDAPFVRAQPEIVW